MKIGIEAEQKLVERLESFGSSEDLWADIYSILDFVFRQGTTSVRPHQARLGQSLVQRKFPRVSQYLSLTFLSF